MAGGNLIRKKNQVLLNTLASGDVAVSSGVISIKNYGEITVTNIKKFSKIEHVDATKKVSSILVKPVYPANDDYGYEGGVSIQRDYQFTGDPQSFYGHSKAYTYCVDNLKTASSGYLNEEDRAELVGYITEMINDDSSAVVTANAKYYLAFASSGTVAVTDLRGATVLASATYANAAALAGALDALPNISAEVDSTVGVWVTSASEGLVFTCQSTKWALGDSYLLLTQKDDAYPFSVFDINSFGTETITTAFVKEVLPLTEVQQIFPILPVSSVGATPNIPILATDYTKFVFYIEHTDAAGLVGSSRKETSEEIVEFFIPKTVADGAYWATILYPTLYAAGLYTPTFGVTTLTTTGASGAGAGTIAVTTVPGFATGTTKFYKVGSGSVDETTGAVTNGTNGDVFYAEIQYTGVTELIVSKITCTTFVVGGVTFTGAQQDALTYTFLGRFDITCASGKGIPVIRNFGLTVETQFWSVTSTAVCNPATGEIITAGDTSDVLTLNVKFAGVNGIISDLTMANANGANGPSTNA